MVNSLFRTHKETQTTVLLLITYKTISKFLQDSSDKIHFIVTVDAGQISILILALFTSDFLISRSRRHKEALAVVVMPAGRTFVS